jgi:hypothetical protein
MLARSVVAAALLAGGGALACTRVETTRVEMPVGVPDADVMKREVLGSLVPCAPGEGTATSPPGAPALPPPPGGARAPIEPGLFVELAILEVPAKKGEDIVSRDLRALALDPAVRLLGAPQIFVTETRPTTLVVEEHIGPLAAITLRDVTARLAPEGSTALPFDLHVGLDLPTPPDAPRASPKRTEIGAIFLPADRRLVAFVKPLPTPAGRMLEVLLTPYVVRDETDLRAIFACKMARRDSAAARARAN